MYLRWTIVNPTAGVEVAVIIDVGIPLVVQVAALAVVALITRYVRSWRRLWYRTTSTADEIIIGH